jgi:hypothetical protein
LGRLNICSLRSADVLLDFNLPVSLVSPLNFIS